MATKKASGEKKAAVKSASAPAKAPAKKAAAKSTPVKAAVKAPTKSPVAATHQEIAQRAHQYWEERGRSHGGHTEDWLRAERELNS